MLERNYSEKSILRRVPLLVGFGEFAKGQGVTSWAELPTQVEYYVAHRVKKRFGRRKPSPRSKKYGECVRNPIQQMLGLILPEYTGQGRTRPHENPFYKWVPGFFDYLRQEKGLTERT